MHEAAVYWFSSEKNKTCSVHIRDILWGSNFKYKISAEFMSCREFFFSSERLLSNMGEHCGRSHKVFWWKEKASYYKREPCEFENDESLDDKGMSRNVWTTTGKYLRHFEANRYLELLTLV